MARVMSSSPIDSILTKLVPSSLRPNAIVLCSMCGMGIDVEEAIVNFGICDCCFEMTCPCNDNHPNSCPLHRYPDVVLNFGNREGVNKHSNRNYSY